MSSERIPLLEIVGEAFEDSTNLIWDPANSVPFSDFVSERFPGLRQRINYNTLEDRVDTIEEIQLDEIELTSDLFSAVETAPLLPAAAVGAVGTAATGISTSATVGASIGAGIAAVTVGGILGALGADHEHTEEEQLTDQGYNLPGHHFIGPGNTADRPESPIDEDDRIAQIHDKEYSSAKSNSDIVTADEKAIQAFDTDYQKTGNKHSLAGRLGLQAKKTVESVIGVQYPKLGKYG